MTPSHNYITRAADIRAVADWLEHARTENPVHAMDRAALDFYRLASTLSELADNARKIADAYVGPIK